MNAIELQKAMRLHFKAGNTIIVEGPPGCGKTQISEQFADARRAEFNGDYAELEINAATANLADVLGFLLPEQRSYKMSDGTDFNLRAGAHTYPYFFFDRKTGMPASSFKRGMLRVEEYGQAQPDVKRAFASLTHGNQRRVGNHLLGEGGQGFDVSLLTNRPEDRSGVGKDFDFMINRRARLKFVPTMQPLIDHLVGLGAHPLILSYLEQHSEAVLNPHVPKEQGPYLTPRSLEMVGNFITTAEREGEVLTSSFMHENVEGYIGRGALVEFMAHVKLHAEQAKPAEVVANPTGARVPKGADGQMLMAYMLANHADVKTVAPIVTYMQRLPSAFGVSFMKAMLRRAPNLYVDKSVSAWMRANTDIMAALAQTK